MIRRIQVAGLVTALALTLAGLAQAHEHGDRDDIQHYAYQRGYRDGFNHGQMDRSQGRNYNLRSDDYEDADRGYRDDMGNREEYRETYRQGYQTGYDDAYNGRGGQYDNDRQQGYYQNGPDQYNQNGNVASQMGFQDGLIDGRHDLTHNKPFRPDKHDRFKDGDHGYSHQYGSKKEYKQEYRQAYTQGYSQGYRGGQGGDDQR